MIVVVDASVAVKWFVDADWALHEDHVEQALALLTAGADGELELLQPPHFLAEVASVPARLAPERALQNITDLTALDFDWAAPTDSYARAIALSRQLDHHLCDTLYHALALETPGAALVTADRRYFDKARRLGQIAWLPDWRKS